METYQYRVDDNIHSGQENCLLDNDGMPAEALPNKNAKSLANIASEIYLNSKNLSESQIEQIAI